MFTHEKFTSHLLIFLLHNLTKKFYGRDENTLAYSTTIGLAVAYMCL